MKYQKNCGCQNAVQQGQLRVTACAESACYNVGDFVIYKVCVRNTGDVTVNNINIASALPVDLTNTQFLNGNAWSPWTGSTTLSSLAPGCKTTVLVGGTIGASAGTTLNTQINVTASNAKICWGGNNRGLVSVNVNNPGPTPVCEDPTFPTGVVLPNYVALEGPDANGCYNYSIQTLPPGYGLALYGLTDPFGNPIYTVVPCPTDGTTPSTGCPLNCTCGTYTPINFNVTAQKNFWNHDDTPFTGTLPTFNFNIQTGSTATPYVVQNSGNSINFPVTYSVPGTYHYLFTEAPYGLSSWSTDPSPYPVTVHVTNVGGVLQATQDTIPTLSNTYMGPLS